MKRATGRHKAFTRRAVLMCGAQAALLAGLVGRLYYLQVAQSDRYRVLADENRINLQLLAPPRGVILDRHGVVVAGNSQNYRVFLVPDQTRLPGEDVESAVARTLDLLGRLVPIGERSRQRVLRDVRRRREFVPVTVVENLSWQEFSRVNVLTPELPGVAPDVGPTRDYPLGAAAAHVVGYVAPVSANDVVDDPLLALPGFQIGRAGVERGAEEWLRGRAGTSHVEVNAHGHVIRELQRKEGLPGENVSLTIDAELQEFASRRMGEESAGAVVLDVRTGDVLALLSTPAFDPVAFTFGMTQREWDALLSDPRKPLLNKAVSGQYPPGSTFKMVVALAALEAGTVRPGHRVYCPGGRDFGDRRFHCWKRGGHGNLTLPQAIGQSCDVYFYDLAIRTGIDRIGEMARRFGLGGTQDVGLDVERAGLIPTRDWKLARIGEPWQAGETLIAGIGQGFVLTTPLQLATMAAMLANGGLRVTPRLLLPDPGASADAGAAVTDPDAVVEPQSLGISKSAMALVRDGMDRGVNAAAGTAFQARIAVPGLEMAGKTGTSQVRSISAAERDEGVIQTHDRPWKERDHAVFVGYAPLHDPRYAISVVVEHGGGGATVAAPIARDILMEAQKNGSALRRGGVAAASAPSRREG